uniref:ZP domain-containing protein n=1 Tax=Setaria digitata TaxID=48799 RepID=A0A915PN48_9BILA
MQRCHRHYHTVTTALVEFTAAVTSAEVACTRLLICLAQTVFFQLFDFRNLKQATMCAEVAALSTSAVKTISNNFRLLRFLFHISLLSWTVLVSGLDDYSIPDDDIINLPVSKFPEPSCAYRLRFYNRNGPILKRQVGIGESVYHQWTCSYENQENGLFCILVNNCTVSNPRPNSLPVAIIDKFGCSLFPTLIPHIEYNGDLEAGLQTNVFLLDIDQVPFHLSKPLVRKKTSSDDDFIEVGQIP